ncbi:MAG: hypothetical protein R3E31_08660 [Chloroflexota bacterium]
MAGKPYLMGNIGFVLLNRHYPQVPVAQQKLLATTFNAAIQTETRYSSGERGLAFLYFQQNDLARAAEAWQAGGGTSAELTLKAQYANQIGELETALRWLHMAILIDGSEMELWHVAGKVCQKTTESDVLCTQFLQHNQSNWLVNSDFAFIKDGWHTIQIDNATYDVEPCPEQGERLCATIEVVNEVPEYGAGWSQCVRLRPGDVYRYSVWLKTAVADNGEWRPIYYQGVLDGETRGFWPGNQKGSSDWTYWEQDFVMLSFQEQNVCFYPVRLLSTGKVWFHSATVMLLDF